MTISGMWRAGRAAGAYLKHAPAERATLPAAGVFWGAAEIVHAQHLSGIDIFLTAAAAAGVTYGASHATDRYRQKHGDDAAAQRADTGRKAAVALAAAGGWLALAARYGILAGPWDAMSLAYAAAAAAGYWGLRRHGPVRAARDWRRAKAGWHARAAEYGLHRSHLLDWAPTWLGEEMTVSTRDTGQKASAWTRGGLAETIAEVEQLPRKRVRVTEPDGPAGRIHISIRRRDPWASPLAHPVLEPVDGFDLPVPCSAKEPLVIGYDPENGNPLTLTVWNKIGAKKIMIVAMQGGAKSALLSCLRERLTAAEDAVVWDINVSSKARENRSWADACDLSAVGSEARERALEILRCARYATDWRDAQPRTTADFVPDRKHPLIVLVIDEIDELVKGTDPLIPELKEELRYAVGRGRSSGVAVVWAGLRGTADWMGGAAIRSQVNYYAIGRVNRLSEVSNAMGEPAAMFPDMTTYGEGQPGVWAIGEAGVAPDAGRSFKLTEPEDLDWLAAERAMSQPALEPGLVAHLGEHYSALKAAHGSYEPADEPWATPAHPADEPAPMSHQAAHEPPADEPAHGTATLTASLEKLDLSMDETLPRDLRERLARMDERAERTRAINAESDAIMANMPVVSPERKAAVVRERWAALAQETGELAPETRRLLIEMVTGGGASGRAIQRAFEPDETRHTVNLWLNRLRYEGVFVGVGKGRAAKWMLVSEASEAGLIPAVSAPAAVEGDDAQ